MARQSDKKVDFFRPIRHIAVGCLVIVLFATFVLWRSDTSRAERVRVAVVDFVVPNLEWALVPVTEAVNLATQVQSYAFLQRQNRELRDELRRLKAWRETALQLEQENARLLNLNKARLDPALTVVTGKVIADSGSPYRHSVLLNVGRVRDGITDGWAVTDGLGLVGRILGVGQHSSRVLLLTDSASRVPVTIQPSGQSALLVGDNSRLPVLELFDAQNDVRPGDRVVSSGAGRVLPAELLVGSVLLDRDGRLRLRLAADYDRMKFLRVLRSPPSEKLDAPAVLVGPLLPEVEAAQTEGENADG